MILPGYGPEVIERLCGSEGELQLQRRGTEFEIIYNGVFIMSTYNGASEKAAVTEALDIVSRLGAKEISVLLGGLGMGYSLRAALDYPAVTNVTVAECEPAVVRWNFSYFDKVNGSALRESRTAVYEGDFYRLLSELTVAVGSGKSEKFQLIMVDTDNGSTWLSRPGNALLYSSEGLKLIKSILADKGVTSFWCADREDGFEKRLREQFGWVTFHKVTEKTGLEGCYYLAGK